LDEAAIVRGEEPVERARPIGFRSERAGQDECGGKEKAEKYADKQ
jgi:hypothetical protein